MNIDAVHELLTGLARSTPALPRAACRGRAVLFDSVEPTDIATAQQICTYCPELARCRAWATAQPSRSLLGVIAGRLHTYNFRYDKKEKTP